MYNTEYTWLNEEWSVLYPDPLEVQIYKTILKS